MQAAAQGPNTVAEPDDFFGKTVVVVGAGGGIGREIAYAFAARGGRLALIDVDAKAVDRLRSDLARAHPGCDPSAHVASIDSAEAVEAAFRAISEHAETIDVLVNAAGISMNKRSLDLTTDEWQRTLDVNLSGVWYCTKAAGARMAVQPGGGAIVSVASIWGLVSAAERLAYCVTKTGVVAMTEVLAVEWAPHGVRVNAVCPGYTGTDLMQRLVESGRLDVERIAARTPLGRLAETSEVADAVVFLASARATFVTGHSLTVDGGWVANGF